MKSHLLMANPQTMTELLKLPIVSNGDICLNHELSVLTDAVSNVSSQIAQLKKEWSQPKWPNPKYNWDLLILCTR